MRPLPYDEGVTPPLPGPPPTLRRVRTVLLCVGLLLPLGVAPGRARAQDAAERTPVPGYALPDGFAAKALEPRLDAAVRRAVASLLDAASPEEAQDAARLVAGVGAPALPHVAAALRGASWGARGRLFSAVAEMDAPDATTLLLMAVRDPAFGVREAAWIGLGKTGDARAREFLSRAPTVAEEPVWRVRVEAVTALRRAALRGVAPKESVITALLAMIEDPDRDVRLRALEEIAPFRSPVITSRLLALHAELRADPEHASPVEERRLVLRALGASGDASDRKLLDVLVDGFVHGDPKPAVEIGRTLFKIGGAELLEDERVSDKALRLLIESESGWAMRDLLARLGRPSAEWLDTRARDLAQRLASGRGEGREDQLSDLVGLLVQADEARGVELLSWFLTGPESSALLPSTRRLALERASTGLAPRLAAQLRAVFRDPGARHLRKAALRAVMLSGGDDLSALLAEALAHSEKETVIAALTLLGQRLDLDPGPRLEELARKSEFGSVRRLALEVLSRRDATAGAAVALDALDDSDQELRRKAIVILGERRDERAFALLLERFQTKQAPPDETAPDTPAPNNDGAGTPPPGDDTGDEGGETPAITISDPSARVDRTRYDLLRALRGAGGDAARPALLTALAEEESTRLRATAAQELRELALPEDAPLLLSRLDVETDERTREQVLRVLAQLGDVEQVRALFAERLAEPGARDATLRLLANAGALPTPDAVLAGVTGSAWSEEQREIGLRLLELHGRVPPTAFLRKLAVSAARIELAGEAVRLIAARGGAEAEAVLLELLTEIDDPARLPFVVREVGRTGSVASVPALTALLHGAAARAAAAVSPGDPSLELVSACAVALGRTADERAARALVDELLRPGLVHVAARESVQENGPFRVGPSCIDVVGALCRGLARLDDDALTRRLEASLSELARDGGDVALDEGYVDGVARYLRDPAAYGLPARRRPRAGAVLRALVPRIAPRLSGLDADALAAVSEQATQDNRVVEAEAAYRASLSVLDVEDALRTEARRDWEQGKLAVLVAQVRAQAGDHDGALAALEAVRAPDPESDELAYLHGYGLVKVGGPPEAARTELEFAHARNPRYPPSVFYLGWVIEVAQGPRAAVPHYEHAAQLDRELVANSGASYRTTRDGRLHPWSHYPYYHARALAAAGLHDDAVAPLVLSIRLDDREAGRALLDPAFKSVKDLDAIVRDALDALPD